MRAQNLYNGAQIVGCRFAFTLPVEIAPRGDAGHAADADDGQAASPSTSRAIVPE
jgi:hypothetical protein